jgi:hypothetical protein
MLKMNKELITPESLKAVYKKKGYKLFENDEKNYNLNIYGVRSSDMTPNVFNDYIGVAWKYKGKWSNLVFKATTDTGLYYLKNPLNVNGTAIIVPSQYLGAYAIGLHQGKYEALRQKEPMKYFRDNNRDNQFDLNNSIVYEEIGYTNIHHASFTNESSVVGKWSAGCMVIANIEDWRKFIYICKKSRDIYRNSFTFTLFDEKDFE